MPHPSPARSASRAAGRSVGASLASGVDRALSGMDRADSLAQRLQRGSTRLMGALGLSTRGFAESAPDLERRTSISPEAARAGAGPAPYRAFASAADTLADIAAQPVAGFPEARASLGSKGRLNRLRAMGERARTARTVADASPKRR